MFFRYQSVLRDQFGLATQVLTKIEIGPQRNRNMKIPFLFPCVSALSPEDDLASMSALLSPISRFWGTK